MGFRFRKSVKILPGIRLNFSKSGISTSLGGPGASINIGPKGTRKTVGLPGTGMSYSTFSSHGSTAAPSPTGPQANAGGKGCGCLAIGALLILAVALCSHKPGASPGGAEATPSAAASVSAGSVAPATFASGDTVYVTAQSLNARSRPSPSARVVSHLRSGQAVKVIDARGDWIKVAQGAALVWVASSQVSSTRSLSPETTQSLFAPAAGSTKSKTAPRLRNIYSGDTCPCSGTNVCIGPRGGRFCITSGGNKRYGV